MGLYTRYHTYVDGKVANGLVTADRLNGEFDAIAAVDGDEKRKRARMADRIYGAKEPISLDSKEVAWLLGILDKFVVNNMVLLRATEMLDHE